MPDSSVMVCRSSDSPPSICVGLGERALNGDAGKKMGLSDRCDAMFVGELLPPEGSSPFLLLRGRALDRRGCCPSCCSLEGLCARLLRRVAPESCSNAGLCARLLRRGAPPATLCMGLSRDFFLVDIIFFVCFFPTRKKTATSRAPLRLLQVLKITGKWN